MMSEGVCRPFVLQSSRQHFYGIWILLGSHSPPSPWLPGRAQRDGFFGALAQSPTIFLPSQECIKFSQMESAFYRKEALVLSSPAKMKSRWPADAAASVKPNGPLSRKVRGLTLTSPRSSQNYCEDPHLRARPQIVAMVTGQPSRRNGQGMTIFNGHKNTERCEEGPNPLCSHSRPQIFLPQLHGACG